MDKEYEILADRLIKALKGQNEKQLTLKLISGEVVSSDTGYTKAMIKISSGVEIQAINKSKRAAQGRRKRLDRIYQKPCRCGRAF